MEVCVGWNCVGGGGVGRLEVYIGWTCMYVHGMCCAWYTSYIKIQRGTGTVGPTIVFSRTNRIYEEVHTNTQTGNDNTGG